MPPGLGSQAGRGRDFCPDREPRKPHADPEVASARHNPAEALPDLFSICEPEREGIDLDALRGHVGR